MLKLDQRGVAAASIAIVIIAVAGGVTAAPVVVDAVDVDPDHPLYALERLGERIRGIGDVSQMKERWGEYQRMVARGKGLVYRAILEEFKHRMDKVLEQMPENVEAKQEIIQWMQQQMPGIGEVRLHMMKEACQLIRESLEDQPGVGVAIDNMMNEIDNYERELPTAPPEFIENIRARVHLIKERIKDIAERYRHRMRRPVMVYIDIDDIIVNIDITIDAEGKVIKGELPSPLPPENLPPFPPVNLASWFEKKLAMFENELAEIQGKLQELSENSRLRTAIETLINRAIVLKNLAVEIRDEKPRRALGLLHAANTLLRDADHILKRVGEVLPFPTEAPPFMPENLPPFPPENLPENLPSPPPPSPPENLPSPPENLLP
jgi:hypothetical protein